MFRPWSIMDVPCAESNLAYESVKSGLLLSRIVQCNLPIINLYVQCHMFQPIHQDGCNNNTDDNTCSYEDKQSWYITYDKLHGILKAAAQTACDRDLLSTKEKHKYFSSGL